MLPVLPAVECRIELVAGDWLLNFSDGIPEAAGEDGSEFSDDGLLEAFRRVENGTAAGLCEGGIGDARNHTRGQRQADDLTLIAARAL
jgi:serine phosphatase RsbU (regulator of sigma subunit)